jgi:hypothetical protein
MGRQDKVTDDIDDPLVRVAFEKKRALEHKRTNVQAAERDVLSAQELLQLAQQSADTAREDFQAIMSALTPQQEADLVLFELQHHQQSVLSARALQAGKVYGSSFPTPTSVYFNGAADPLQLHTDKSLLNELQVVWRK